MKVMTAELKAWIQRDKKGGTKEYNRLYRIANPSSKKKSVEQGGLPAPKQILDVSDLGEACGGRGDQWARNAIKACRVAPAFFSLGKGGRKYWYVGSFVFPILRKHARQMEQNRREGGKRAGLLMKQRSAAHPNGLEGRLSKLEQNLEKVLEEMRSSHKKTDAPVTIPPSSQETDPPPQPSQGA